MGWCEDMVKCMFTGHVPEAKTEIRDGWVYLHVFCSRCDLTFLKTGHRVDFNAGVEKPTCKDGDSDG